MHFYRLKPELYTLQRSTRKKEAKEKREKPVELEQRRADHVTSPPTKGAEFFSAGLLFFFIKKATEPATTIVLSSDNFHGDVLPSTPPGVDRLWRLISPR